MKIFFKYLLFGCMLLLSPLTCTWFPFLSCLCSFVNLQRSFMFFKGLQNSLKLSNCLFFCAFSFNPLFTVPAVWLKVTNFRQFRHTTVSTKVFAGLFIANIYFFCWCTGLVLLIFFFNLVSLFPKQGPYNSISFNQ